MNILQDNSNINKKEQNIAILATFQNIEFYDFQDGLYINGFLIISKEPMSFNFRWIPYKSNQKNLSSYTDKKVQLISSIHLFRVVIETSYKYCEVSLYCVDHNDPTIFRASQEHINFSHQLAQIFTINTIFLSNPNWIYLTNMFLKPPTIETGSVIYYIPCYNGKFSFPVFLNNDLFQKFKQNLTKTIKENEEEALKKPISQTQQLANDSSNRIANQFKSFFTIFSPATEKTETNNSFLSNFSQIFSKYKIKSTNMLLPITKSDFMLLTSQNVPFNEIKKMIIYQGMDEEFRREMWPIFLSILPNQEKRLDLEEGENEYQKILRLRISEYKSLKFQWFTLSSYQLVETKKLRSVFYTIKMDVKRTAIPDELVARLKTDDEITVKKATFIFKKILRNILKTFSIWNSKIKYTQGINEIAVPFVCVALYDIINTIIEQENGLIEKFIGSDSDDFDFTSNLIEEKEAIAFWCFVSFQEKSQNVLLETSMSNLMEVDLPEILEIVKKQSNRDAFKFLKQYQLDSLNFLVSPFMLLFRRCFSEEKVERLWDSIIVLDRNNEFYSLIRKKNFELAFAASVIIFAVPLLKKKIEQNNSIEQNNELLLLEIPEIFESLPIDYVIRVALLIENDMPPKNHPRITYSQQQTSIENDFFSPLMLSESNEYSRLGLFC